MNVRLASILVIGLGLAAAAIAQNPGPSPQAGQNPGPQQVPGQGGYGQRGQRGGMGMGMMGRGVAGTVTEVAADHYTIKSFTGQTYIVHYDANTRMMKQPAGGREGRGQRGGEGGQGMGRGQGGGWARGGGNPPQPIKASDIKVGDAIAAMGEVDASAKSVGAVGVMLLDPERAKQMEEMEASYGKTWLMGKVTAVDGVKVTIEGSVDSAPHTFVADENTDFRERRNPITLADVKVGDMVRVDGAVKAGAFTAATVNVMGIPPETRMPRDAQPQ